MAGGIVVDGIKTHVWTPLNENDIIVYNKLIGEYTKEKLHQS